MFGSYRGLVCYGTILVQDHMVFLEFSLSLTALAKKSLGGFTSLARSLSMIKVERLGMVRIAEWGIVKLSATARLYRQSSYLPPSTRILTKTFTIKAFYDQCV